MPPPADVRLLRARRAVDLQLSAYLGAGAVTVLGAAAFRETELAEWLEFGFVAPLIIAALLSVFGRPGRRVREEPGERVEGMRLATVAEEQRLSRALFSVLFGLSVVCSIWGLLVVLAVAVAHVLALSVLRVRLGRLERRLGAPLYQRLSAGIWREPLYALRDPGTGDPEVLAALGRRAT